MLQLRTLRRNLTAFRLFLLLLAAILVYHYLFKPKAAKTQLGHDQAAPRGTFSGGSVYQPPVPVMEQSEKIGADFSASNPQKQPGADGENERSQRVIAAFRHCWEGYKTYAWGFDELHPVSHSGSNWFSLGLTLVDALDTALLMDQKDIYAEARDWVASDLTFDHQEGESNVFEITIRVLGGFLSTYHLSQDDVFLKKAVELADRLLVAFDTASNVPLSSINLKLKKAIPAPYGGSSTAEATTLQMEFKYLSYLTKDPRYWNAAQKVMKTVFEQDRPDGLVPIFINPTTGKFSGGEIRLGSRGDSYYEYLVKQWLLTNQTEAKYAQEYRRSVVGVRTKLLGLSHPNQLFFVGETDSERTFLSPKMDHLVCFLPGTLAWGATKGRSITRKERARLDPADLRDLDLAEELARSCYEMYAQTATGLSAEIVFWKTIPSGSYDGPPIPRELFDYHRKEAAEPPKNPSVAHAVPWDEETDANTRFGARFKDVLKEQDFSIHPQDGHNLLRPETVESLFILYRITGKKIYREWGWKIFVAFEKYCQVEGGYTSLLPPPQQDKMETFFVGETLKYLYLLLTDRKLVPLDKYIFNTEAHPFPVFDLQSNPEDKALADKLLFFPS
ncbi:hypothetical protein HDU91_000124 [Kappamyces sp. JEL0680]|nr:hypothetical protein HDU91_000124 [Kappamyces sp. JEL0680]